mmetsp:Transcript_3511/g.7772  ORF Transcript_3511/g.7772 Transcript_3511/m.7772 type:complete len:487 (+) Transcript_3511:173-1633(+)|eukprot:CAMPEP_0171491034 /NCGR_PEP_ID=MMETSP0958-20121227/3638_1 /TAXON_ID=87120 /ORGANISM="Aurantiochytrium limacinum, Strain ATCCMYA-1381" /LENGTH=486 /DNA_ID=CAMNT_0012024413 /DNA_START=76 /DNA_END=1536 /DNA_ORIENTATION=+
MLRTLVSGGAWRRVPQVTRSAVERRKPLGLADVRGFAKYKRVNRQEQIASHVRYEKRQKEMHRRAVEADPIPDDDYVPKYIADKIRKSQRGPGNVKLGRKDLRMGLTELDLMNLEAPDESIPARVKLHHKDLLRKGIPKPKGPSPASTSRRQQRAESRLEQSLQEAFLTREFRMLDSVTRELVGSGGFSSVECTRVKVSGDLTNVTVYWRPPLHADFTPLNEAEMKILTQAVERSQGQIRAIVAKRMQHFRAPFVTIELDESATGLEEDAEQALREILEKERQAVASQIPELADVELPLSPINPSTSKTASGHLEAHSETPSSEDTFAQQSEGEALEKVISSLDSQEKAEIMMAELSSQESEMLKEAMEMFPDMEEYALRKLLLDSREEVMTQALENTMTKMKPREPLADDDDDDDDFYQDSRFARGNGAAVQLPSEDELPEEFQAVMKELRTSMPNADDELINEILRELQEEFVRSGAPGNDSKK